MESRYGVALLYEIIARLIMQQCIAFEECDEDMVQRPVMSLSAVV